MGEALRRSAAGAARFLLVSSTLGDVPADAPSLATEGSAGACPPDPASLLPAPGEVHPERAMLAGKLLLAGPPGATAAAAACKACTQGLCVCTCSFAALWSVAEAAPYLWHCFCRRQ